MQQFGVLLVLLVASVGDVLGDCTGEPTTFQPGELAIGGKKGKCSNAEVVEATVECSGECTSNSKITFVPGKKPNFEGECKCCKIQTEEKEVKLKCTGKDGVEKEITKTVKFPSSCGCGDCKKGGKKGGKGGKGKRGGKRG